MSTTIINSLNDLIHFLDHHTKEEFLSIKPKIHISIEEIERYSFWNDSRYARNCIARRPHYELILVCWEPGQGTPIHDHGGRECFVAMLSGTIDEAIFIDGKDDKPVLASEGQMHAGEQTHINDEIGYHTLSNECGQRVMSLHLYMDPIESCRYFDEDTGTFKAASLEYHSIGGKLVENNNVQA